jgi:hypothetical protein
MLIIGNSTWRTKRRISKTPQISNDCQDVSNMRRRLNHERPLSNSLIYNQISSKFTLISLDHRLSVENHTTSTRLMTNVRQHLLGQQALLHEIAEPREWLTEYSHFHDNGDPIRPIHLCYFPLTPWIMSHHERKGLIIKSNSLLAYAS